MNPGITHLDRLTASARHGQPMLLPQKGIIPQEEIIQYHPIGRYSTLLQK